MKYIDEFRQPHLVQKLVDSIHQITTKPWTIMEVCGGQTHAIVKFGLQELLPKQIRLIHGPGCPVCVTPIHFIDHAIFIAAQPNTILCSYGDMLRVPGSFTDLLTMKAKGSDIRMIHSPSDVLRIAQDYPEKQVIFFAVGFETTAPANAMAIYHAQSHRIHNLSMLSAHVLVLPAMELLMKSPDHVIQGFLAAGHVCTVSGYQQYHILSERYRIPVVVTGFEPLDILQGIYLCIEQLENEKCKVTNQYNRSVQERGNLFSLKMIEKVFQVVDREWRGIGKIPSSGLDLKKEFQMFDAALRFPMDRSLLDTENGCISGLILQGKKKPNDCSLFGNLCTPEKPFGAPMVSTEGACSAYYQYRRKK